MKTSLPLYLFMHLLLQLILPLQVSHIVGNVVVRCFKMLEAAEDCVQTEVVK